MEKPVLNMFKDPNAKKGDRPGSQIAKAPDGAESYLSGDIRSAQSGFGGSMTNRDLTDLLKSARDYNTAQPKPNERVHNTSEDMRNMADKAKFSNKSSVAEGLTVPVRQ